MHANGWKWVVQAWKFSRWPFKNSILFVYFWGFVLRGILHVLRHESGGQKRTWESKFSSSTMWVPGMELISSAWQQAPLLAEPTYHLSLTFCKNQSWGGILHDKAHITSVTSIDKASIHATTLSIKIKRHVCWPQIFLRACWIQLLQAPPEPRADPFLFYVNTHQFLLPCIFIYIE